MKTVVAYKRFSSYSSKPGCLYAIFRDYYYKRGEWVKADTSLEISIVGQFAARRGRYQSGFHAYKEQVMRDAIPVLLRKVKTLGKERLGSVLVAREIYVPRVTEEIVDGKIVKKKRVRKKAE